MGSLCLVTDSPHRIRLRRPWVCQILDDRVCWTRRFGRPTGVSANERVWLVLEGFPADTRAVLNGESIPANAIDVTARLHARNELKLETPLAPPGPTAADDDPPGRVSLEIRPSLR
jgi:hypothetical protein